MRTLRFRMVQAMNLPSWIIVVALCLLTQATPSWSADDAVKEKQRRFLITGMRAEREKLRSGQVVMVGDHWRHSSVLGKFRISVRFEISFDNDARVYRFTQRDYVQYESTSMTSQRKEKQWSRNDLPHGTTPEGIDWITEERGGTVVHTPEYDLHLAIGKNHVSRLPAGTVRGTYVREWDLAALGLVDWYSFDGEYHLIDILNSYETRLSCHSVEAYTSGLTCMKLRSDWHPNADSVEWEIWIDEKRGMSPIRISRKDLNDSLRETSRSDVSWKEINGVMVPASFRINVLDEPEITEGYDLTLEWSHVNEPLDPKLFTPAGITANNSAMVANMELGKIVVERVHPLPLPMPAAKVTPKPPSRLGWIVLGHLVAGVGFAWWYYRRRAKRQSA